MVMQLWLRRLLRRQPPPEKKRVVHIDYNAIHHKIGYVFQERSLLEKALKHRSILPALNQNRVESNERLELLGDSVLGLVVTEFLFRKLPEKEEGDLTAMKSLLVSRRILARVANELQLGNFLLLSESEIKSGGKKRPSIIADALEALIGAIYLDGGIDAARTFIVKKVLRDYNRILHEEQLQNFKSILLEYSQSKNLGAPFYIIRSEEGPDHNKLFTVEVKIQNKTVGVGIGNSKKRAEQNAAQDAVKKMGI